MTLLDFLAYGANRLMGIMEDGLWAMYGPWIMDYGLWTTGLWMYVCRSGLLLGESVEQ